MALTKISAGGFKDDAASQAKIADEAVDEARLQISNAGSNGEFLQKQSGNTGGLTWAAANQYTHPNHSGEVTSTADGAQVIASNIVDEDNLKISNAGSNGQYLQKQSGNTGGLTWADVTIPPSGNTVDLVADGAIGAGKPVIITTAGKAKQVGGEWGTNSQFDQSSEASFQGGAIQSTAITYDPDLSATLNYGWHWIAYKLDSDEKIYFRAVRDYDRSDGTISDPNISGGTILGLYYDETRDRLVFLYADSGIKVKLATVNNQNSLTWASSSSVDGTDGDDADIADIGGGKFVTVRKESGTVATASVGTISSSHAITYGSNADFFTGSECAGPRIAYGPANQFLVIYKKMSGGEKGYGRIGTISGTSISFGTEVQYTNYHVEGHRCTYDSEAGKYLILYNDRQTGSKKIKSLVVSVSGTTPSYGTALSVTTGEGRGSMDLQYDPQVKSHVAVYTENDASDYMYAVALKVSGTSVTKENTHKNIGVEAHNSDYALAVSIRPGMDTDGATDDNRSLLVFRKSSNNAGTSITLQTKAKTSNATWSNVIGFAPSAINDTATGTINCEGNNVSNQSGLTPGTRYYVKNDGTLGTSAASTNFGGIALASDKLLIQNQRSGVN